MEFLRPKLKHVEGGVYERGYKVAREIRRRFFYIKLPELFGLIKDDREKVKKALSDLLNIRRPENEKVSYSDETDIYEEDRNLYAQIPSQHGLEVAKSIAERLNRVLTAEEIEKLDLNEGIKRFLSKEAPRPMDGVEDILSGAIEGKKFYFMRIPKWIGILTENDLEKIVQALEIIFKDLGVEGPEVSIDQLNFMNGKGDWYWKTPKTDGNLRSLKTLLQVLKNSKRNLEMKIKIDLVKSKIANHEGRQ